jgi:hypothetical protein
MIRCLDALPALLTEAFGPTQNAPQPLDWTGFRPTSYYGSRVSHSSARRPRSSGATAALSQHLGGLMSAEERVDLAKFRAIFQRTASRIQQQPDRVAASGPTASVRVVKNRLFEARVRDFTFQMDQPETRGGGNTAPSPMEYFVAGAAG